MAHSLVQLDHLCRTGVPGVARGEQVVRESDGVEGEVEETGWWGGGEGVKGVFGLC